MSRGMAYCLEVGTHIIGEVDPSYCWTMVGITSVDILLFLPFVLETIRTFFVKNGATFANKSHSPSWQTHLVPFKGAVSRYILPFFIS